MKEIFLGTIFVMLIFTACDQTENKNIMTYPVAKKVDSADTYFGTKVLAPYRWMEDENLPELKKWIEAENKVTQNYLTKIPYRKKIEDRLTQLANYPKQSAPFMKDSMLFYYKNTGLQNQSVLYVKINNQPEKVLLDPNKFSDDGTTALGGIDVSKNGKYLAYSISKGGSDWREIFVKNILTGKMIDDHIKWAKFSGISWYKDGFFYSGYTPPDDGKELTMKNEFHKLYYHQLGTSQTQDSIVMQNKELPLRMFYAQVTSDERYLIIYEENEGSMGNKFYVKDLVANSSIIPMADNFDFDNGIINNEGEILFVRTNKDAENYKLVKIDLTNLQNPIWSDILPNTKNVLESVVLANNKLVVSYMVDAHNKMAVYDLNGQKEYDIPLPALGSIGGFNGEKTKDYGYFSFDSFTYPSVVYRYSFNDNSLEKVFEPEINFDFADYETKQVFYPSKDGTNIPMFIVHKKGMKLDGNNPVFLYGYGGFNISLTPGFSVSRLVLLENGFVFAMPNLRGGGEYGKKWHKAGMKLNKQNVFDDFIAAAEYLVKEKYTNPKKIVIHGGSNGGLLVGAVTNQRPDLFAAAIPSVGVMDMLRYQKFTIGWNWITDYGSSDDSIQFQNLYKYSPLHNIKENVDYPAVLVTTADHDDRVVPAHSFKYIATLQEKYKGQNPVLIRIETMAGHGAGKSLEKYIEETADMFSFAFYNVGISDLNAENK